MVPFQSRCTPCFVDRTTDLRDTQSAILIVRQVQKPADHNEGRPQRTDFRESGPTSFCPPAREIPLRVVRHRMSPDGVGHQSRRPLTGTVAFPPPRAANTARLRLRPSSKRIERPLRAYQQQRLTCLRYGTRRRGANGARRAFLRLLPPEIGAQVKAPARGWPWIPCLRRAFHRLVAA